MNPRVVVGTVLAAALVMGIAATASAQDGGFTVRESTFEPDGQVSLTIAVTQPLDAALDADQVRITENGDAVEDLVVEPIGQSQESQIGVALVMDVSGSTEGEPLEAAKDGAQGFLDSLTEIGAQVVLVAFSDDAGVVQQLTDDLAAVSDAIEGLEAGGETALYDAVLLASSELSGVDGQRSVVVFSDGADTASTATLDQAVAAAVATETPITTVVLATPDLDASALQNLASASGGSSVTVDSTADLTSAFEGVASELTNQYVITYTGAAVETTELDVQLSLALPTGDAVQTFTVRNPREVAPPAVPPAVSHADTGLLGSSVALTVGLLAAFGALVAVLALLVLTPRSRAARLLDRELAKDVEGSRRGDSSAVAEALRRRMSAALEATPSGAEFQSRLQKHLDQGAIPLKAVEFLAIIVVGGLLLGSVGFLAVGWRGVLVFAPVGVLAPYLFMIVKRSRRLSKFLELLPDTLQLMAGSLAAGYGVLQSIDMVTKESEDPMSTEFNRVLVEARLGVPLEESLESMADRMDSDDFRWVVLAMNIQREVGGNLAALMNTVARTLREREALRRHIRALSAEGKLSAIILVALPFFLAGYLILVNPEYVGTLTQSLIGWLMIIGGIIGLIIGVIWIRGLIRAIEV